MSHPLKSIQYGRWAISCDAESTRSVYACVATGSPEECGCDPCLNFAAQRAAIYPTAILALFEELGITTNREAEIYHLARLESGRHLYGGWFHFVGSILSGTDAARKVAENIWKPDLEAASEYFNWGFSSRVQLVRKPFEGLQLVQVEFTAQVPWVIAAAEPR